MSELQKAALLALEAIEEGYVGKLKEQAIDALQDALNRQYTHSENCWSYGPAHYECALRKIGEMITNGK